MKHLAVALAALAALTAQPGLAAAEATYADDNVTATVDCAAEPSVVASGNNITLSLTGTCKDVMLSGNNITVTGSTLAITLSGNTNTAALDVVDRIVASGNMNTVTWKRTSNPKKLKKPRISKPGTMNTIARAK